MADDTTDTTTSATTTATDDTSTAGATDATAATDATDAGDDTTVLGSATTDAGTGDGEGEGEKDDKTTPAADAPVVPETYELKLTAKNEAGEDVAVDLDPALVEAATPILKDVGLTNEQADKLMPLVPKIQEQLVKQQNDAFAAVRADWAKEAQADPEIGGAKFKDTVRLAAKALDHFGAPSEIKEVDGKKVETNEFRRLLNESGLGNHPVMLKMFSKIGAAASEDGTFVRNTSEVKTAKSREEVNYPDDVPKTA